MRRICLCKLSIYLLYRSTIGQLWSEADDRASVESLRSLYLASFLGRDRWSWWRCCRVMNPSGLAISSISGADVALGLATGVRGVPKEASRRTVRRWRLRVGRLVVVARWPQGRLITSLPIYAVRYQWCRRVSSPPQRSRSSFSPFMSVGWHSDTASEHRGGVGIQAISMLSIPHPLSVLPTRCF